MTDDLYTIGVRKALNDKGIANERIGYNNQTKYVTIDGQNFVPTGVNKEGRAFQTEQNFNNAYGQFDAGQKANQAQTNFLNPTPQVNPYDSQIADILAQITQRTTNPQAVDPYGTAQYAAAQAQVQQGADRGIQGARESLGDSGLARSSIVTDRAQRIQNEANQYLQTQLLPQIVQQLQADEDRKTQGLSGLLNALSGQQGVVDTRQANEQDRMGQILEFFTGRSDRAQDITREDNRFAVQDQQYQDGVNYQKARDSILDERYKVEFEEDAKRWGLEFAIDKAVKMNQMSNSNAQLALSKASGAREQQRLDLEVTERADKKTEAATAKLDEERRGMAELIRSGEYTPAQALAQINEDEKLGFYTKEEANALRKDLDVMSPSAPIKEITPEVQMNLDAMPSDKEIDKMTPKGAPRLDWRAWYKSPKGRVAGTTFEDFQRLYGPKIEAAR